MTSAFHPPVLTTQPDLRAGKNIVVCADGTGNADIRGRGSNVFKLFEAVDTTSHLYNMSYRRQVAFYHEGVGTESFSPMKIVDGASGFTLGRHVRELYAEIARVYAPDDRLYLFGFSRGAFTARTLAGFISSCGIPKADEYGTTSELDRVIRQCYDAFLRRSRQQITPPGVKVHPRRDYPIEFLGVWDTVDAVGLPFPVADYVNKRFLAYKVDVREVPTAVRYGCQALALDEQRESFAPVLWNGAPNLEQVWFPGVHSDIGGGYPRQGLSLIPLHWMMERACARGLRFNDADRTYYDEHQIVADKLHNSRSGLALYYRWRPRRLSELCTAAKVEPQLHISVFDRTAQAVEGYAPANVPPRASVNFTDQKDAQNIHPPAIGLALTQFEKEFNDARSASKVDVSRGIVSYWLFVLGTIAAVPGLAGIAGGLVWTYIGPLNPTLIWLSALGLGAGAIGLFLAYVLAQATDTHLDDRYSELWHRVRPSLRNALSRQQPAAV
jgi:uncharacterized protein (DUF2235 family)